ncbi:MAG: DUF2478 domain-containing protein [Rhodobacteraceae bacterium]|jgi:nucleoside-triphosphatase THEP1|nr:DUF2478 domain-containing protein [Paracoccaceae bacterium]
MSIAYTMAPGRGDTDLLLQRLVQSLEGKGLRATGTVQINTDRADEGPCDMDVLVLPDGPSLRISQSLGRNSRGCRLDPAALETAVGLVEVRLRDGVDFLVVNKFGKHEAEGRGFRPVIAEAVALGIPVLVGLNALNRQAFLDFTDGLAVEVAPDLASLSQWLLRAQEACRNAA